MTASTYRCDLALVDGEIRDSVAITVADGRFLSVDVESPATPGGTRMSGLVVPGLANAHSHAFHRALRSRTQSGRGSFWTWRELMYRAAERLDPDSYYRLARATFAEMAMAGITAVGEFHYLHHQPDGTPYADPNAMGEALIEAASEAGIRITLLDTMYLHGGLGVDGYRAVDGVQRRFSDRTADSWVERVDRLHLGPTHRLGAAVHSVRAVDPEAMKAASAWAEPHDAPIHAHVSEQPAENEQCLAHHGLTPSAVLDDAGVLSRRFTAVHATHITTDDIASYARAESTVCLCPTTERDLGDGIGPTAALARAGVAMALGSDSHAVIDLLEEARAVELDERLQSHGRGVHCAADLFEMATTNGHASLGWDDAGAIAPGQRADLVAVSLDSVRTTGVTADTALEAAVFAATAADVSMVMIDGKTVVEDGRHTNIDVAADLHASITDLMDR